MTDRTTPSVLPARKVHIAPRHIPIVDGHPDPDRALFVHALADAYAEGAAAGGHAVRRIELAALDFPLLRTRDAWENQSPPAAIAAAQTDLAWADHLVVLYSLWLGDVPALLKAFLEQSLPPGSRLRRTRDLARACWAARACGWSSPWGCLRFSTASILALTA